MFFSSRYLFCVSFFASFVLAQDIGGSILTKCTTPGQFALTFDDGPGPSTGKLLEILKKKKVKATFFSLGVQARDVNLGKYLKIALNDGHQIASHTDRHLSLNTLTPTEIKEELRTAENSILQASGVAPTYMRPPYGDCNSSCQEVLESIGYHIVAWNVDSNDWQYVTTPENHNSLVANMVTKLEPSNSQVDSFISLQHDIHEFSIERTSKIIDLIREKGYRFTTVAECLGNQWPMYRNASIMETAEATPATVNVVAAQTNTLNSTPSNHLASESINIQVYPYMFCLVLLSILYQ